MAVTNLDDYRRNRNGVQYKKITEKPSEFFCRYLDEFGGIHECIAEVSSNKGEIYISLHQENMPREFSPGIILDDRAVDDMRLTISHVRRIEAEKENQE